jgi:hypothetical protein
VTAPAAAQLEELQIRRSYTSGANLAMNSVAVYVPSRGVVDVDMVTRRMVSEVVIHVKSFFKEQHALDR